MAGLRFMILTFAVSMSVDSASAQGQPLQAQPITEVTEQARRYITSNGSYIGRFGTTNPEQLIGRAIPCAAAADGTYTLSSSVAFAMEGGRRFRADASAMGEPLMILASGVISGEVGVGVLNVSATSNRLTRMDIAETVRLSIETGADGQALGNGTIKLLRSLDSELAAPNTHWCIVHSVSVWRVRYETYERRNHSNSISGLWIVSGNYSYARDNTAVVPYQIITVGITPYSRAFVLNRAAEIARAEGAQQGINSVIRPRDVELSAIAGTISAEALAAGDAARSPR